MTDHHQASAEHKVVVYRGKNHADIFSTKRCSCGWFADMDSNVSIPDVRACRSKHTRALINEWRTHREVSVAHEVAKTFGVPSSVMAGALGSYPTSEEMTRQFADGMNKVAVTMESAIGAAVIKNPGAFVRIKGVTAP